MQGKHSTEHHLIFLRYDVFIHMTKKLKAFERKMKLKYGRTYTRKSMTNAERDKFEALMKKRTDAAFSAMTKK